MKKAKSIRHIITLLCLLVMAATTLTGCFGASKVPDSILERFVRESEYYNNEYSMSWTAKHDFDKAANIDTVLITLTAKGTYGQYTTSCTAYYQYNSAAKNWTFFDSDYKWTKREYTFNNKLKGNWNIADRTSDAVYILKVSSISNENISVDYSIKERVLKETGYGASSTDVYCELEGSSNTKIKEDYFIIPVILPNEFYSRKHLFGEKTQNVEFLVGISIKEGIYEVNCYDGIRS